MDKQPVPDQIIEIDLPLVAKQGLYLTIFPLIFLLTVHFIVQESIHLTFTLMNCLYFIMGYVGLIVLHEFFHLLGFRLFGKIPWKRMKVGVNLKLGVAYATTDQLMTNQAIRKALLLPFWMTGILPAIIGLIIENGVLITLSACLIGGAAGDFSMYKALKKLPNHWLIQDDPELPRLHVFSNDKVQKSS